jgi:hypothetical protein
MLIVQVTKKVTKTLRLQRIRAIPSKIDPPAQPVRPKPIQPKGLRMRCKPSGFVNAKLGTIGESEDDAERPRFKEPAAIIKLVDSSPKKKRKDDDGPKKEKREGESPKKRKREEIGSQEPQKKSKSVSAPVLEPLENFSSVLEETSKAKLKEGTGTKRKKDKYRDASLENEDSHDEFQKRKENEDRKVRKDKKEKNHSSSRHVKEASKENHGYRDEKKARKKHQEREEKVEKEKKAS